MAPWCIDSSQAQLQTKRLEQAIQRVLRGIVTWIERSQKVRARHPDLRGELLDLHGSHDFGKRELEGDAFVDRCQQELWRIPDFEDPPKPDIPISTSPCRFASR